MLGANKRRRACCRHLRHRCHGGGGRVRPDEAPVFRTTESDSRRGIMRHGRAFVCADCRNQAVAHRSEAQRAAILSRDWASVHKSPDVDAYVLAWIASHVSDTRRPRTLMTSIPMTH